MIGILGGESRVRAAILVGMGGFVGSVSRYGIDVVVSHELLGTFLVNVSGCFLLGIILYAAKRRSRVTRGTRLLLGTGFTASFTTYSTFILDVLRVDPTLGATYAVGSYAGGLSAIAVSRVLVDWFYSTPDRTVRGDR